MSTAEYEDWCARSRDPNFHRTFAPDPADTVELPALLVDEGPAAADTIKRYLCSQWRRWAQEDRDEQED